MFGFKRMLDRAKEEYRQEVRDAYDAGRTATLAYKQPDPNHVCKRCGVVYVPRGSICGMSMPMVVWKKMSEPPFKSDESLLLNRVTPRDYCPRCEGEMREIYETLVQVLEDDDDCEIAHFLYQLRKKKAEAKKEEK